MLQPAGTLKSDYDPLVQNTVLKLLLFSPVAELGQG